MNKGHGTLYSQSETPSTFVLLTFSEYIAFFCTHFIGTRSLVISAVAMTVQVGYLRMGHILAVASKLEFKLLPRAM